MANWTIIDATAVQTGKYAALLAKVRAVATAGGAVDPLPEMIADVVAQLRAGCSTGNQLDQDTSKIPNSLKGLAVRMVVRRLKDYIQMALSADERDQATEDRSYLNRIADSKLRFELPDNPAGNGEMQSGGSIDVVSGSDTYLNRRTMDGAL